MHTVPFLDGFSFGRGEGPLVANCVSASSILDRLALCTDALYICLLPPIVLLVSSTYVLLAPQFLADTSGRVEWATVFTSPIALTSISNQEKEEST